MRMLNIPGKVNGVNKVTKTKIHMGCLENWGECSHWVPRSLLSSAV